MVRQATARNRAGCRDGQVTLRHGDGVTIPFPDNSADNAITVHIVYFMPDPAATFVDIARVLRPGGTLVVACRTSDTPTPAWMDPDVYRVPTADQIKALLGSAGFVQVEQHTAETADDDLHLFAARLPDDAGPA